MTQVLYVKGYGQQAYDGFPAAVLWYQAVESLNVPLSTPIEIELVTGAENPTATPYGQFNSISNGLDYYAPVKCGPLLSAQNAIYGYTYYTSYALQKMEHPIQAEFDALANVARTGDFNDLINKPSSGGTRTTSASTLSLVGTGATGTQISATLDSSVNYNVSTSTTASIGGPSTSLVALKICATNNVTEASWTTVGTVENDQTITLAVTLNSVQLIKGQLCADIPAGWYVKLVNSGTGTHSETFVSGQKTIYS